MRSFIVFILLIGASLLTGWHAAIPAQQPASVTLSHKTILADTSIDGPAFVSATSTYEGVQHTATVIAWTGTDPAHRLNIMTSADLPPKLYNLGIR